jgi:hypothetical protein
MICKTAHTAFYLCHINVLYIFSGMNLSGPNSNVSVEKTNTAMHFVEGGLDDLFSHKDDLLSRPRQSVGGLSQLYSASAAKGQKG